MRKVAQVMEKEWKNQITEFENSNDIKSAIKLLDCQIANNSLDKVELYLRTMFMVLDFLVEGHYSKDEYLYFSKKLKSYFDDSYKKFYKNAEYLAFAGMMITRAEWYFDKSFDDGIKMIKKAIEIEPYNICYESLYHIFEDQRLEVNTEIKFKVLSSFFAQESNKKWLEGKGLLGAYILGIFENVYAELQTPIKI